MKVSIIFFAISLISIQISAQIIRTPGVYIVENSSSTSSIAQVATAIPAFIGITENYPEGEALIPVKINSMLAYEEHFGAFKPYEYKVKIKQDVITNALEIVDLGVDEVAEKHIMYYALKLYFTNGGGPCYIVPIPNEEDQKKLNIATLSDSYINGLAAIGKLDEVTLLVCPDAVYLAAGYYEVCQAALSQCSSLKDRFAIFDVRMGSDFNASVVNFRNSIDGDLKYGAAYMPNLNSSLNYGYDETKVDVYFNDKLSKPKTASLSLLKESNTNIYNFVKKELAKHTVRVPPSGAIAGIYAQVDRERGVWKAPAGVVITGIEGPTYNINQIEQHYLNIDVLSGKSINPLRSFSGKETLVWGSRTLAGNDNEWRYISVRRMANTIEESTKKGTAFAVFEPNDAATWIKVKANIESYLFGLWQQGALVGSTPEQSYFVKVGLGETMTVEDIKEGRMIVEIGYAPVRPAEFIILRFSHKLPKT